MQRLIISRLICFALLLGCLAGQKVETSRIVGAGVSRRFLSVKYGFSVPLPPKWYVSTGGSTPFYFNFSPVKAQGGGALPAGGAEINIIAHDELPSADGRQTLSEWADRDADSGVAETLTEAVADMPIETGIERAVQTAFDLKRYGPDDQAQHQVNLYWVFRGKLFATHLVYTAGDREANNYVALVLAIMRGIRPSGPI